MWAARSRRPADVTGHVPPPPKPPKLWSDTVRRLLTLRTTHWHLLPPSPSPSPSPSPGAYHHPLSSSSLLEVSHPPHVIHRHHLLHATPAATAVVHRHRSTPPPLPATTSSSSSRSRRGRSKGPTSPETLRRSSSSSSLSSSSPTFSINKGLAPQQRDNPPHPHSPPRRLPAWEEGILPAPQGLIKATHSKALEKLVKQGVESYIDDLKKPSNSYKDFKPIKPSPIVSGGSLHHYKPPNLGKQAFDDWMKKQRKKDSKSSYNLAFGRRNHSNSMTSPDDIERQRSKKSGTFLKSVRGKLNARREVINAIHGYHINSEARAQLERRACEFEREKKERMQQKMDFGNQATIKRRGRRRGQIILELPLNH